MGKLIMMVGLPASGKSTYAKELARTHAEAFVFSSDDYRERLLHDVNDQSQNELVFQTLYADARKCLEQNCTAIIDATNISRKSRRRCLEKFKDMDIIRECCIIPTFFNVCIDRDENRERTVGKDVIMKFARSFEVPMPFEGFDDIYVPAGLDYKYVQDNWCPTVERMTTFDQKNKHHKFLLGEHCNAVTEGIMEADDEPGAYDIRLAAAAMYHDVGKLYTQTIDEEGQAHYYNHANISALWFLGDKDLACQQWMHERFIDTAFFIGEHMHIRDIVKSEKAINKYKKLFGESYYNALKLFMECDNFGSKNMPRLLKTKYQNLQIEGIDVAKNDYNTAIYIKWSCPNTGFGEYTLYIKDGSIKADTECMDSPTLKMFTKALMAKLVEKIEVL